MDICHPHNLVTKPAEEPRPFGLRVSLPPDDPLIPILGPEWEKVHWFATAEERERTLQEMSHRHLYSRQGDLPQLVYEAVTRDRPGA